MKRVIGIVIILVALAASVTVFVTMWHKHPAVQRPRSSAPVRRYLGVSVPGNPLSMSGVRHFAAATGARPNMVSYYTPWYSPFSAADALHVIRYRATPLIFLDTGIVPVRDVAYGNDHWLTGYANAVKAFGRPIVISFDSEFDGPWWLWGYNRVSAATYVAAWRRVVNIFRAVGATNVTWMWTIAVSDWQTRPVRPWWPGSTYVKWVGVNGYWRQPDSTFRSVFAPTFAQVRAFTDKPILISETGANPNQECPIDITELFQGVEDTPGLLGFIWFDYNKNGRHNYRIDDDPAALAAFRKGAHGYEEGLPKG